jgi:putative membrane protein insertion efficiency factor|tara:strand:+ start:161 stop:406 length:246 start_codon:yes stop_codon:yes gene_type:complete
MINKYISFPLILMIRLYQLFISPLLGQNCRYLPTCSEYSVKSLKEHGLFRGSILSIKRISKCHPWGSHGFDPVPKKNDLNK